MTRDTPLPERTAHHSAPRPAHAPRRPIVGDYPASGLRVVLERPPSGAEGAAWRYEGHVFTPTARHALRATVSTDGAVEVVLDAEDGATNEPGGTPPPPGLGEKVRLLLRTAYKQAQSEARAADDGGDDDAPRAAVPPPRRLVRWRGEK